MHDTPSVAANPSAESKPSPRRFAIVLVQAAALLAAAALLDWLVSDAVPLGWLYLLPMALAATVLPRIPLLLLACLCTAFAEAFDGFPWDWVSGVPRELLYFSAFAGSGLFVHGVVRGRRAAAGHLRVLQEEMAARRDAEEQLRVMVENSPVAVFTADAAGTILLANEAAGQLFTLARAALTGESVARFLPPLFDLPVLRSPVPGKAAFHTAMQCRGHRANGEIFQADVWFSTYGTSTGPRLAVFVADSSDDLRDREEASLHQLLTGSRIVAGAISHEVRNVCAAIAVVHENLRRSGSLAGSKDFEALGTLVLALERIASVELREAADQFAAIDLRSLLEEVQIVISPALREEEVTLDWEVPRSLPPVWADRQSLLQVLLNLIKNSRNALEEQPAGLPRRIGLRVAVEGVRLTILVSDSGPGVRHPEFLFKPFQQQARASGLGLYISRALMRSFSGDLHHLPQPSGVGARFAVELQAAP
jgi:two-component system sensor kinase FixL